MRRTVITAQLVWLLSSVSWCAPAVGQEIPAAQPAIPELMKREVSREGAEYLQKLRKDRTPFGANDFNLDALRAGMAARRLPTIKDVTLSKVKVGEVPCEWVLAPGADPDVRLLYIHGGGFVAGSGGFYLAQAAHISAAAKCAVLLPDYRLAPEHPFPAGLEDCVLAHRWLAGNGPAGPAPARATFVAGDSAGGSLALATLLALRDRKLPMPAGGIALSPTTDLTLASDSLKTVSDPIISAKTMPVFRDHYLGKTDPKNPLASPVFGDYRGLPPLLIQVGEHEMLRDDSIRVAKRARADGIPVKLEVWPGMFHVFQSHEPLLPEAREAIEHMAEFMRSSLRVKRNVPYADPAHERQVFDVYAPQDAKNLPVVFWIHGGGWQGGDKSEVYGKPQAFMDRGFVFVSTNYRLLPSVDMATIVRDVAKSIRWTHDHIAEYGGDPKRLLIMGHSAGAQLAALVCTDDRYLKAEGLSLVIVKGCIPVDGDTYDVPAIIETAETRWRVHGLPKAKFGHREKFGNDPAKHREFSAVTHVAKDRGIPPFLILHVAGHPDTTAQALRLGNVLKDAGVPTTVFAARETTHSKINADLGQPADPATVVLFEFLGKALKQ
jgi:acetyl esterase/lipase